jgi:hypothetical protein
MCGDDNNLFDVGQQWTKSCGTLRKNPCNLIHEHSINPPFKYRWLRRPPRWVHKNESLCPLNVFNVGFQVGQLS